MAVRAVWRGVVTFGVVTFPAATAKAVDETGIAFNTFHLVNGEMHAMGRKEVDKETGDEVPRSEQIRAYVMESGTIIPITDAEIEAILPEANTTIGVDRFVSADEVPAIRYYKHEYLMPDKGGEKAYVTLRAAMQASNTVALAKTVRRGKEYAVALRPMDDGVILVSYLSADDEIRLTTGVVPEMLADEQLVGLTVKLIDKMRGHFTEGFARDTYRDRVLELVQQKAGGEAPKEAAAKELDVEAIKDLLAQLQESLG